MLARAACLLARSAEQAQLPQMMVRTFAAAAAAKTAPKVEMKLPAAPLQLSGTSGAIATLAWQVAAKENVLAKVQDELYQLVEIFKNHTEIRRLATDPFLPDAFRRKVVRDMFATKDVTEVTKRLVEALADENSLSAIVQVTLAYEELMLAHKKEVHCTVVTAQPLDDAERAVFTKQAQAFVEPGFKLVMKEKVDRKLLGGFVLEFEDRLVDMSAAKKLEEFNNLVTKLENDLK
ncbi:hypothetical protein HYH02_002017 [Chlamydomonas schloesseri]|uniref:Uncharacterized protein n=1 Tax=Chlamydomonas schloesseri TaxID=2026947 RepID=A0A835WWR2_9CHLO|nr:hypothetical protein HYH02_002017 [Chlamydomonas schloesseri]|eukprot:KAG2453810.1 hypothetical protein HYH02_002017 [Chlamydomonas schloesseri]